MSRRKRALAAMIASLAVTVPIGYAAADDAAPGDQPGVPGEITDPAPATSAHPEAETFLSPPPAELVATCRERLADQPDDQLCNTILLVDQGRLEPGAYTNAEYNRAYEHAMASGAAH